MSEEKNSSVKKVSKKVIGIVCAAAVFIVSVALYLVNRTAVIDINKYIIVETDGYDGYGSAYVKLDIDSLKEDYAGKIKFTNEGELYFSSIFSVDNSFTMIQAALDINQDKYSPYSNGDDVYYTITVDDVSLGVYIKNEIKASDGTVKVTGLEERDTIDVFEDAGVGFRGVNGNGSVYIKNEDSVLNSLSYRLVGGENRSLSNGDKVTIEILNDKSEIWNVVDKTGCIPESLTKEYVVSGLGKYITNPSELSETSMEKLIEEGKSKLNIKESDTVNSIDYIGTYFIGYDDEDNYIDNQLYLVYKINVAAHDYTGAYIEDLVGYQAYGVAGLVVYDEGAIIDNDYAIFIYYDYLNGTNLKTYMYGFKSTNAMIKSFERFKSESHQSLNNIVE